MKVLQTKRQTEMRKFPSKSDVLRELNKRSALDQHPYLNEELLRLELGDQGEQTALKFIEEFGESHWRVLKNVWLDYYGIFECDLLLITRAGLYAFEIKNYSGTFELRNSQCLVNGQKTGHNPISQGQKVLINLEAILKNSSVDPKVNGAIAFLGEHNTVTIHDELADIDVVARSEFRDYIWKIAKEEREFRGRAVDSTKILRVLEKYETDNPFTPDNLSAKLASKMQKGIRCSHCGSFEVDASNSYISCPCGMLEPREEAIVRTICEYGVVYYKEDLTSSELVDFFDGAVSRKVIAKYLNKHFIKTGSYRHTRFSNIPLPFSKNLS